MVTGRARPSVHEAVSYNTTPGIVVLDNNTTNAGEINKNITPKQLERNYV